VIALGAALSAVVVCCPSAGAIVGGTDANISQVPYQVALVKAGDTNLHGLFCGGTVSEDGKHVITAAHCVFDNAVTASGQPILPGALAVVTGADTLTNATPQPNRVSVTAVSFDPRYDPATFSYDAALLTLATTLPAGSRLPAIMSNASLEAAPAGTSLKVSGWGDTGTGSYPPKLKRASVPLKDDSTCDGAYGSYEGPLMVCAGDDDHDACFGDSGGPLISQTTVLGITTTELAGIVSFGGATCADETHPGVYTQAPEPSTTAFLEQANPQDAPRQAGAGPSVQGDPVVGQPVSCDPGAWTGVSSYAYQFVSGAVARTTLGEGGQYVVQQADVGQSLTCVVKVANAGGIAIARSAPSSLVPSPPPPAPPVTPNPPQVDTAAPVARVTKGSCTRTRCTLLVTVTDAGFSAGIKTLKAVVRSTYRGTCKRKGKRVRCTRTRTRRATVRALSARRFRVVASSLPVGRHVFALVATDKAGHTQAMPTRKTLIIKPRRKRR
jgi:trypsin